MIERWLRMSDACKYAGLSRNTVRQLLRDGFISSGITPGGHHRIDRESIDEYMSNGRPQKIAVDILRSLKR